MSPSAVSGVGTRWSPATFPASSTVTASILVPPTSTPTVRPTAASEAQQGADTPEHVEVGVVAADLEVTGLVQRLLHRLLDHIGGLLHALRAHRTPGSASGEEATRRAPPPERLEAVGHEKGVHPALDECLQNLVEADGGAVAHARRRPQAI